MEIPDTDHSRRRPGRSRAARSRQFRDSPPLTAILANHDATLKCQFDAFADYVADAEKHGTEKYPLYAWTKATIENGAKKKKYVKSFTLYVEGEEVYAKTIADALESDLRPLVGTLITAMSKYDTNPASNPQPPQGPRN